MTPADLSDLWRAKADGLARFAPAAAEAFKECADLLEDALRRQADEELTMAQAAEASGLSQRRLRELLAAGDIPNAGKRGAPRLRRGDLPRRRVKPRPPERGNGYDPQADAARLLAAMK
jgi:hypothetical protein